MRSRPRTVHRRTTQVRAHASVREGEEEDQLPARRFHFRLDHGRNLVVDVQHEAARFLVRFSLVTSPLTRASQFELRLGLYREVMEELSPPDHMPPNCRAHDAFTVSSLMGATPVADGVEHSATVELADDVAPCGLAFQLLHNGQVVAGARAPSPTVMRCPLGYYPGTPQPLGFSFQRRAANFALASRHATHVSLLLEEAGEVLLELELDPARHKTGAVWHVALPTATLNLEGLNYCFRVNGALSRAGGSRFLNTHPVADPYAAVVQFAAGSRRMVGVLPSARDRFDWAGDRPPRIPRPELVMYRLHPGGFTSHSSSPVAAGSASAFAALRQSLHYLDDLGVNAVLLDPVAAHLTASDFLGTLPASFMAPHPGFGTPRELKELVRDLHLLGKELFVSVHLAATAEGTDANPRALSFRGVDAATFYRVREKGHLVEHGGGGCALDHSQQEVRQLVAHALRHWVAEYRVDGFYLHGMPELQQGRAGERLPFPPLLEALALDPLLSGVKMFAADAQPCEARRSPHWGVLGERNTAFRDDVRRFLSGRAGSMRAFAARLTGSGDLLAPGRPPHAALNVLSGPDGLTLADAILSKADFADDEDEPGEERLWCVSSTPLLEDQLPIQHRQVRNALTALLLAGGVPLMEWGDEYGHTRRGAARAASSAETSNFFRWDAVADTPQAAGSRSLLAFTRTLTLLRRRRAQLLCPSDYTGPGEMNFFNEHLHDPDWDDPYSRLIAVNVESSPTGSPCGVYFAFNARPEAVELTLPLPPTGISNWTRITDSSLLPPLDVTEHVLLPGQPYLLNGNSSIVLEARLP